MEIRHPATDSLTESTSRELKHLLADSLPIERQAQDMSWGMVAPGAAPTPTAERFVRFVNRDNTLAASMKSQAIVIETTNYTTFESLRDIAMRVVDARAQVSSLVGVERIGLRYVLEIRVPVGVDGRVEWGNWIAEPLLGPQRLAPAGLFLTEWQGAAVYREPQPGKSLVVRYGPGFGQALDANYHLRRVTPVQPGPYFLMDIDSFWTPQRLHSRISPGRTALDLSGLIRSGPFRLSGDAHRPHEGRLAAPVGLAYRASTALL